MGRNKKEMKGVLRVDKGEENVVMAGKVKNCVSHRERGPGLLTLRLSGRRREL